MNASVLYVLLFPSWCFMVVAIPSTSKHTLPSSNRNSSVSTGTTECFGTTLGIRRVDAEECQFAINQVFSSPDVMEEKRWSSLETRKRVLKVWQYGTCSVELISWAPTAEDMFSEYAVWVEARQVIEECVEQGLKLGGKRYVGPRSRFAVVVWAKMDEIPISLAVA